MSYAGKYDLGIHYPREFFACFFKDVSVSRHCTYTPTSAICVHLRVMLDLRLQLFDTFISPTDCHTQVT